MPGAYLINRGQCLFHFRTTSMCTHRTSSSFENNTFQ